MFCEECRYLLLLQAVCGRVVKTEHQCPTELFLNISGKLDLVEGIVGDQGTAVAHLLASMRRHSVKEDSRSGSYSAMQGQSCNRRDWEEAIDLASSE